MRGQPVLMLVDLVVDRFLSGTPKRISREAPVLILSYAGESFAPGGGANAVANVMALGGRPIPLGLVGDDDSGRELLAELAKREIPTSAILVRRGYRTPTKTRILAGFPTGIKQQVVRLDREQEVVLSAAEVATLRGSDRARRSRACRGPFRLRLRLRRSRSSRRSSARRSDRTE